jgi:hypothetical protein
MPTIVIGLYRPTQPANDYAHCRCELVTATETTVRDVPGVDALDCIVRCLQVLGTELDGRNESIFGGRLRWEASDRDGDIGLPMIDTELPPT